MLLNEHQIRQLWEAQNGAPFDDDVWDHLRAAALGPDDHAKLRFETPQQALDLFQVVRDIACRAWGESIAPDSTTVIELEPPPTWHGFQARRFEEIWRNQLHALREAFGLDARHLVDEKRIADIVCEALYEQTWPSSESYTLQLHYPLGPSSQQWTEATVYVPNSWGHWSGPGAYNPAHRLYHLVELSEQMESFTGISKADAVRYILSGGAPRVPWIRTRSVAGKGDAHIQLMVGSLAVTPEEVAAAYKRAQKSIEAKLDTEGRYERRPSSNRVLMDFCRPLRSMARPMPWDEIVERWNRAHPERTFKNGPSLRRVFGRLLDEAEGGETDGNETK